MNATQETKDLKAFIRKRARMAIHQNLRSVIQEVTEEELRAALRDPGMKGALMDAVRTELQRAIEELRSNNKKARQGRK